MITVFIAIMIGIGVLVYPFMAIDDIASGSFDAFGLFILICGIISYFVIFTQIKEFFEVNKKINDVEQKINQEKEIDKFDDLEKYKKELQLELNKGRQ